MLMNTCRSRWRSQTRADMKLEKESNAFPWLSRSSTCFRLCLAQNRPQMEKRENQAENFLLQTASCFAPTKSLKAADGGAGSLLQVHWCAPGFGLDRSTHQTSTFFRNHCHALSFWLFREGSVQREPDHNAYASSYLQESQYRWSAA